MNIQPCWMAVVGVGSFLVVVITKSLGLNLRKEKLISDLQRRVLDQQRVIDRYRQAAARGEAEGMSHVEAIRTFNRKCMSAVRCAPYGCESGGGDPE